MQERAATLQSLIAVTLSLAGCVTDLGVGAQDCEASPELGVGVWSAEFVFLNGDDPSNSCACEGATPTCFALYQGMTAGVNGNFADLRFRKISQEPAMVDYAWWLVEVDEEDLSCTDRDDWVAKASGVWHEGEVELEISTEVWPSEESFYNATVGEEQRLALVTGGQDHEEERIWFTPYSLAFSLTCRQ